MEVGIREWNVGVIGFQSRVNQGAECPVRWKWTGFLPGCPHMCVFFYLHTDVCHFSRDLLSLAPCSRVWERMILNMVCYLGFQSQRSESHRLYLECQPAGFAGGLKGAWAKKMKHLSNIDHCKGSNSKHVLQTGSVSGSSCHHLTLPTPTQPVTSYAKPSS